MIRFALLTLVVASLSVIAWRDWYKALCGLIVLMAFVSYSGMPRAMFGIPGISPFNFLYANILLAAFASKGEGSPKWGLPNGITALLILYLGVLLVAIFRYGFHDSIVEQTYSYVPNVAPNSVDIFIDYFVNGIKWVLPGCLMFMGCNSKRRLQMGVFSLMLMYFFLALLIIKWMPLGLLTDGEALQARAVRVLDREIGYYRTNLSVMLAGAFWLFIVARNYFPRKYGIFILGGAGVVLLGMFLTGGRGGYMAWAAVGLIMSFAKWRRYLILAPILVLLIFAFIPSVQDRILGTPEEAYEQNNFTTDKEAELAAVSAGRTETWPRVVEKIKAAPLTGYGFGAIITSGVTLSLIEEFNFTFFHPHNAYLQTLIDNGILGSLPIALLFFIIVRTSWRLFNYKGDPDVILAGGAAVALVFTFLVAGMTGQSFYPEERSVGMWCAVALMARVALQYRDASIRAKGVAER